MTAAKRFKLTGPEPSETQIHEAVAQALAGDAVLTAAMLDRLMHQRPSCKSAATATGCETGGRVA